MDVEFLRYQYENRHDGVITKTRFKIGIRHLQVIYMAACSAAMGAVRGSIGIAVMAVNDVSRRNDTNIQIHNWDYRMHGTVLSSFFFGYAALLVPADLILEKINGKAITTTILAVNGALCLTMPNIVNRGGWIATCNALFMMGMTQACLNTANQSLLKNWMPPNESYLCSSFVYGGLQVGVIISIYVAGILSEARLGWELIFYSLAMTTLSMAVICAALTASSPTDHPAVGDEEKEYIREAQSLYRKRPITVPWRTVLRTRQFWGVTCAHAASSAIFVFYLVDVPVYLTSLNISINDSAFYVLLAVIAMWILHAMTSPTIDWLTNFANVSNLFNATHLRKLINAIGAFVAVSGLTVLPNLIGARTDVAVIVLTATLASVGFQYSGFLKSLQDMSENFPGSLLLMTSSIAGLVGALTPIAVGFILTDDVNSLTRWRIVFILLASIYALGNIAYTILGSGERQVWDEIRTKRKCGYHNMSNQLELEELNRMTETQENNDKS
ncbi:unnamed protein product [Diatraea saccharalis]|uniref:Inorganic phosphate cotransporter n=1 Tax=Diatraea saccharalis TaxID=40085 RepID=A0A9N9QZF6_9NEOP|nr:unnamed protein product [Diatraea saccharalis]